MSVILFVTQYSATFLLWWTRKLSRNTSIYSNLLAFLSCFRNSINFSTLTEKSSNYFTTTFPSKSKAAVTATALKLI